MNELLEEEKKNKMLKRQREEEKRLEQLSIKQKQDLAEKNIQEQQK